MSLQASIGLIEGIGTRAIAQHREPLIQQLGEGFAATGYPRITSLSIPGHPVARPCEGGMNMAGMTAATVVAVSRSNAGT